MHDKRKKKLINKMNQGPEWKFTTFEEKKYWKKETDIIAINSA